ncbi:MAG: DUF4365 domain-containing protein [bacterium]|nr:DUF4365 domain-containing protein [bacterium]
MIDTLLSGPDRKEALSRVYVKALAACAGCATSVPEPDRDSVDLRIHGGGLLRPALDLQLKATTNIAEPRDGLLPFRLSIKNYRDLSEDTQTPRLLVVLELPTNERLWMTVQSEELVLRRRAYWLSLQWDHDEVVGQESITVYIPERNVLDVEVLQDLMERSRTGGI